MHNSPGGLRQNGCGYTWNDFNTCWTHHSPRCAPSISRVNHGPRSIRMFLFGTFRRHTRLVCDWHAWPERAARHQPAHVRPRTRLGASPRPIRRTSHHLLIARYRCFSGLSAGSSHFISITKSASRGGCTNRAPKLAIWHRFCTADRGSCAGGAGAHEDFTQATRSS